MSLFILMFNLSLFSQNNEIDSLREKLNHPLPDTVRINLMNELSDAYIVFDLTKSIEYANKAIDTSQQLNYKHGIATGYLRLSAAYLDIGDYKLALDNNLRSIDLFESTGDPIGRAEAIMQMAYFYKQTEHYDRALQSFKEAYSLYKAMGRKVEQSEALNGIGLSYFQLNKYDEALEYYTQSLTIVKELQYKFGISSVLSNMGKVYKQMQMPEKAIECYHESMKSGESVVGPANISIYHNEIGNLYTSIKDFEKAEKELLIAARIAKEVNSKQIILDNYLYLSELSAARGDYQKALSYYKHYSMLKDSLLNDNKERQINQLLVVYQTDKDKRELAYLKLRQQADEARQSRLQYFRNSLVIGICMLAIIAFLLYYRYKEKVALNDRLQELVALRTRELMEAKDKAERSDQLKSEFLANMSHEIRTPMNAIVGFSNLIADPALNNELRETYTHIIIENSNELLNLIQNIVEIAQAETGNVNIQFLRADLRTMMESLYSNYNTKLKELGKDNISIAFNIPDQFYDQEFETDPHRLQQILTNLLDNAVKFTEQGLITYGYTREDGRLRFFVRDTGLGISSDQLPFIFDKFYRLQGYENKLFRGSGIGLSLSQILVEKLGGSLTVTSEPGKGSEFFFSLPVGDPFKTNT